MIESNMMIMRSKRPGDYAAMWNKACNFACRVDIPPNDGGRKE